MFVLRVLFRGLHRRQFNFAVACVLCVFLALALVQPVNAGVQQVPQNSATWFQTGNVHYLANTRHPRIVFRIGRFSSLKQISESHGTALTVLHTNASSITQHVLEDVVSEYTSQDDVFSQAFLRTVHVSSEQPGARLHRSATEWLAKSGVTHIVVDPRISTSFTMSGIAVNFVSLDLEPGPYYAIRDGNEISISTVYRLYEDTHRAFLYGTYSTDEHSSSFSAVDSSLTGFSDAAIPVPSRLYSMRDSRPFAGYRIAVKDMFDIKGLITSGGSRAWASISSPTTATAPSLQRIIDLGGVLVGKYKLAQFGSGADPWDWQDEQSPFNPRGDGWLTCAASSSGGGCSVAAYEWLDLAIGSDTGCSMRRPAALSGTYGQRPSQGMMTLEGAMPLGGATDTAGVFARDPVKWARFSKHWYHASMRQSSETTGLPELHVPERSNMPRTILYPDDYLPVSNQAAQRIIDGFINSMATFFDMKIKHFNFTATVQNASDLDVANLAARNNDVLNILDTHTQFAAVGKPLLAAWAERYDGAFPLIDPAYREAWATFATNGPTSHQYNAALRLKRKSVEWYEQNIQFSAPEMCSESVLVYDIGTGGLPSYRERGLNELPAGTFLATVPEGTVMNGAGICPLYGCVDVTLPIGQVEYSSPITRKVEYLPVSVDVVMKRGAISCSMR